MYGDVCGDLYNNMYGEVYSEVYDEWNGAVSASLKIKQCLQGYKH